MNSWIEMFNFVLSGLNHRTAKLDLRQMAAFNSDQLPAGLDQLRATPGILEAMIISTCNRVEILAKTEDAADGSELIETFLSKYSQIPIDLLRPMLYSHVNEQAVRHLFRVASSLDSLVVGEPQILGQVKSCYSAASEAGAIGAYLNSLLQAAFRTAKRVRSETSIGEYPVSVSSAAIELVRKIFGDLGKKSILIVGAGEMGEAALRYLSDIGVHGLFLANRNPEKAREMAEQFHALAVPFQQLSEWISKSDVVFVSTGASETLIDCPMIQRIMHQRKNAPLAFIDISVPRNVDPKISTIDNVFCYDIDDLQAVVEANLHERVKAASAAEKIVEQEAEAFCAKLKSFDVGPIMMQVQGRIEEICKLELRRCLNKIGPQEPKQLQELESMISRIAGKIAHPLMLKLRNMDADNTDAYMDLINQIIKPMKNQE
jgi:glutamyl-tRNA reductase